jgi:hypothetical protein
MKKLNWVGVGLLVSAIIGCGIGNAQETAGSFSSINLPAAPVQTAQPDSIVQITAEMQGLQAVAYGDLPVFGTYWEVMPGGCMAPLPGPFYNPSLATYAITDNIFLVDATYGQLVVNPRLTATMSAASATTAAVQTEATAVANLIDQVQAASTTSAAAGPMRMSAMSSGVSMPPGFGDLGSGGGTPAGGPLTPVNYGTNLWLLETNLSFGNFSGIISNTTADVEMELQYTFDLTQPWQSANWFVYGSELTNWTAWNVPAVSSSNLFLRVRSWGVDANGLPIWWEQQYGLTNVNPNALDLAGDGWTIYQKYELGVNPNTFYTPAAPQGLTVNFNQTALTAAINWLPSQGNVANYTVEKSYQAHLGGSTQTSDYTVTSGTAYQDNIAGNSPDVANGSVYDISYRVKANYQNGSSTGWTPSLPLQQATVAGAITPGPSGASTLVALGIPANAALVRLLFVDESAVSNNNTSFDYTENIPVSLFTNALYPLPTAWNPPANDAYGSASYAVFVESVDSSGNSSAPNSVTTNLMATPFYDGRSQLKENLIFQLRAAPIESAFSLYFPANYGPGLPYEPQNEYDYPSGYAFAGLFPFTGPTYFDNSKKYSGGIYGANYGGLDVFLPFEENCLFRNFVFSLADVDDTGNLTTGAGYPDAGNADFLLLSPPTYLFQTNATVLPDLLSTTVSQWILPGYADGGIGYGPGSSLVYYVLDSQENYDVYMSQGYTNWFGLPYVSMEFAFGNTAGMTATLYPGGSPVNGDNWGEVYPYLQTAQPQFQTVKYCFYQPQNDWLPGSPAFSPTNDSPLLMVWNGSGYYATNDVPFLIVPAGTWTQLAGYAKLQVTNSTYSGVYGYLGQYFKAAYQVDGNGNVTTNAAGVISPYGNYFATAGGQAALVTMPDLDTGAQGTCVVYSVSLQLDKNHDGTMDLSLNSPDATSINSPFVFWCNNNFDRYVLDADDNTYYDDDVLNTSQAAGCYYTPNTPTPDCNYKDQYGNRMIPTVRDLEDFARLWICGIDSNLVAKLPANSTITLNWGDVGHPNSGNPVIDLFTAVETNGGIGYLTNATIAGQQANPFLAGSVGRLGPGQSIQLYPPPPYGGNYWPGSHYIWCGVSNGTGGLNLTIKDGGGKVLAQSTSYIQIVDIKQMYERWTVGDVAGSVPLTNAVPETEGLPAGVAGFRYPLPASANTPYILFVHGWNMSTYDKDRFAESAFKRLYWQGYQGRFGAFFWPTYFGFTGSTWQALTDPRNFDYSENIAWQSAAGLLNELNYLNTDYPGQVYMLAHSMGNVVAGEALRLAGNNQVVNTYVASQGAISAHTYDATVTTPYLLQFTYQYPSGSLSKLGVENYGPNTPDIYVNWLATNSAAANRRINFYNQNDFALAMPRWGFDQITKPDFIPPNTQYAYNFGGNNPNSAPWNNFYTYPYVGGGNTYIDIVTNLNNHYKVFAYAAESRSTALGATPSVGNLTGNLNLSTVWPTDPTGNNYTEHFWHSAEFRGDCWQEWNYWNTLLFSSQSGFNITYP